MKYIFITIETQDGERQYHSPQVMAVPTIDNLKTDQDIFKLLYDSKDSDFDGDVLIMHGGEINLTVYTWKEITLLEFNVLKRFI